MSRDSPYARPLNVEVESFILWMSRFENQDFHSVQAAYERWLWAEGFMSLGDNYTEAVTVMLIFLSRCIANPKDRRYLSNPTEDFEEWTVLQVTAPEEGDDQTYWEFLTEANYHKMYADWRAARSAR